MDKNVYAEDAITWAKSKSKEPIKAIFDGYDSPQSFTSKSTGIKTQPDLSFLYYDGRTHFVEIVVKSGNQRDLITKWKLLSFIAGQNKGKLHLLAPKGTKMFSKQIVTQYNIAATIHSLNK